MQKYLNDPLLAGLVLRMRKKKSHNVTCCTWEIATPLPHIQHHINILVSSLFLCTTSTLVSTCEVGVVRGVDEVMGQRLVHVIKDVQPLRRYDGVLLSAQIARERLQTDLVWRKTKKEQAHVWNKKKERKKKDLPRRRRLEGDRQFLTSFQLIGVGLVLLHDLSDLLSFQRRVENLVQPGVSLPAVDEVHELVQRDEGLPLGAPGAEDIKTLSVGICWYC